MPRSFPTMESLTNNAQMRNFRQPHENEAEEDYREALAQHVHHECGYIVEAMEIRAKVGWNGFSPEQNKDMLRSISPEMARFVDTIELQKRAEGLGVDLNEVLDDSITEEEKRKFQERVNSDPSKTLSLDEMEKFVESLPEENIRTTSGAIMLNNEGTAVLLVTSLKTPQYWVFPKGGLEPDLTPEENAIKEMKEEAGIVAFIHNSVYDEIVEYPAVDDFPAKKQREIYFRASFGSFTTWEEFEKRKREWFTIEEAGAKLPPHQKYALAMAVADFNLYGENSSLGRFLEERDAERD